MICSEGFNFSLPLDEKNYMGTFWIEDWRLDNMDDMEKVCLHFVSCGHHLRVSYVAIEAFYTLLCEHVRKVTKHHLERDLEMEFDL